jgi:hypothetical protein
MKKIGGLFLALLAFFGSTLNVFADAVEEVVEEKTQTIDKKDYESLKDEVEKKVFDLNKKEDGYVYDFEISITEEKEEVVISETKKVTSEQKFTSSEDAKKYYDEYQLEDSWKKGELSIISNNEDVVVNGDQITITCKEETCTEEIAALENALNEYQDLEVVSKNTTSKNDIKKVVYAIDGKEQELYVEDALKLLGTLSPEYEGYTLIKNEMVLVKEATIDVKTFEELMGNKKFETYDEAKAAADKFLESEEYKNQVAVVVAVYDDSETTKNTTNSLPFISEELAWTALIADATAELEKAIEEGKVSVEGKIAEIKKALEDAAKTGKLNLTTMELDGRIVYYSIPEKKVDESSKDVSNVYNTKEEAEKALELAKTLAEKAAENIPGATVKFENVEIVKNDTAVLDEGQENRGYRGNYSINQPDKYYSIKNGNSIVIWTENELDETTKEALTKSLKEENASVEVTFLSGFGQSKTVSGIGTVSTTVTQSFLGPVKSLKITDQEAGVKVYFGDIKTGETWTLSYTIHTVIETWSYEKTEINYGFDYIVDGIGEVHTRSLFQVQSILAGKIYNHTMAYRVNNTETYTSYVAQFDVYKEELKTNATVAYKITREKAATGTTGPSTDEETPEVETKPEEDVVLPPNTGVEVNFFLEGALLISILVAAVSLKKLCK